MRITTWNVNSLKARQHRVEAFLADIGPEVLCLQETKMADSAWPALTFEALGYESAHYGNGRWNGVAILSKVGLDDVTVGFGDGIDDPYPEDCRLITAKCSDVSVSSIYVPNGRDITTEFYERKLLWLDSLHTWLATHQSTDTPLAIVGDWNIAPEDRDVWNPARMVGSTHVTEAERARLAALRQWGLVDAFRSVNSNDGEFTWWDYRGGSFHKGEGLRIDLAYVTTPVADRVVEVTMHRDYRKGDKPSDHAPVTVLLR